MRNLHHRLGLAMFFLLLLGSVKGQAQAPSKTNYTEIVGGIEGLNRFESPRLLLKKTRANAVLRISLLVDGGSEFNPSILPQQCIRTYSRSSDWTIAPGIGLEKRLSLADKVAFTYGAEIRLEVDMSSYLNFSSQTNFCSNQGEFERILRNNEFATSGILYPFIGFRLQATDHFSFGIETGANLGLFFIQSKHFSRDFQENLNGGNDIEIEHRESLVRKGHFANFPRPFFNIGYTF